MSLNRTATAFSDQCLGAAYTSLPERSWWPLCRDSSLPSIKEFFACTWVSVSLPQGCFPFFFSPKFSSRDDTLYSFRGPLLSSWFSGRSHEDNEDADVSVVICLQAAVIGHNLLPLSPLQPTSLCLVDVHLAACFCWACLLRELLATSCLRTACFIPSFADCGCCVAGLQA
jgi:hypothetical protein